MDRSTSYPFRLGAIEPKLVITGPIVEGNDADRTIDELFGRLSTIIIDRVIPSIVNIVDQVEIEEHPQGQSVETLIEFEVLGNAIQIVIATRLDFVVDKDLIRTLVTATAAPGFMSYATRYIGESAFYGVFRDPERVTYKETGDGFVHMSGIVVATVG